MAVAVAVAAGCAGVAAAPPTIQSTHLQAQHAAVKVQGALQALAQQRHMVHTMKEDAPCTWQRTGSCWDWCGARVQGMLAIKLASEGGGRKRQKVVGFNSPFVAFWAWRFKL